MGYISCSCYQKISIHAPRMGSDRICHQRLRLSWVFQSTLPAWGATQSCHTASHSPCRISIHAPRMGSDTGCRLLVYMGVISIHAPRMGSDDKLGKRTLCRYFHFNPRSPHGERPLSLKSFIDGSFISIHAPRRGSDLYYVYSTI